MRNRFLVSLKLSRLSVNGLLGLGTAIVSHINTNVFFSSPLPALSDVTTALDELKTAADNAVNGGVTDVAIMDAKRLVVEQLLTDMAHYVESVANDPTNDGNEEVVIDSAGMTVKKFTPHQKRVFTAKTGALEGTAKLTAAFVRRGVHNWGYTLTPENLESWIEIPATTKASTIVLGLTRGSLVSFRHRDVTKDGISDWEYTTAVIIQ